MKILHKGIAVCLIGASLTACANGTGTNSPTLSKANVGTVAGGAAGAVAGSQFGKGRGQLVSVAVGTLLGAALGRSVGASLDEPDLDYYKTASQTALENAKTGVTSTWKNPDTGTHGAITPIRTYQVGAQYCREYTQTINIGGRTDEGYGKACRQKDGSWKVVA